MTWTLTRPKLGRAIACSVAVLALSVTGVVTASASTTASTMAPHTMKSALIAGHLYLGNPGAGSRTTVVSSITVQQVKPTNDGVVVRLRATHNGHHYKTDYSVVVPKYSVPVTGYQFLKWVNHPGPAKIHCTLTSGHLFLGKTPIPKPHIVVCTAAFYQVVPDANGVIIRLRFTSGTHHYHSDYSLVPPKYPTKPTGFSAILWAA
jgi:hypothetical protein